MKRQHRRTVEMIVVLAAYVAVYVLGLGSAVGAALPGSTSPFWNPPGEQT